MDTVNRNVEMYPDTNDIVIELDNARIRRGTVQMSIGSIELPSPQFTIEDDWKNIFFDEGILIAGDLAGRAIQLQSQAIFYTAFLPTNLNASTLVVTGPTTVSVTTSVPHALEIADYWGGRIPISLIGVSVANPNELILNSTNTGFLITSPTTFNLTLSSTALLLPVSPCYVFCPPLSNPDSLCTALNAALAVAGVNFASFTYRRLETQYILKSKVSSLCLVPLPGPEINLSQAMGFSPMACQKDYQIITDFGALWRASIAINSGFYTGDLSGLGNDINIQFNRFNFETPDLLLFSNAAGTNITVPLPQGRYTVETLAAYLQNGMNSLDPLSNQNIPSPSANIYIVTFVPNPSTGSCIGGITGVFSFACNGIFGLEFSDSAPATLPLRMGFNNLAYRNGPEYTSARAVMVPQLGYIQKYFTSRIVQIVAHSGRRAYRIDPTTNRVVATTVVGTTALDYTVGSLVAHGFQVNDVLSLSFPANSVFRVQTRVSSVVDAFSFTIEAVAGLSFPIIPGTVIDFTQVCDSTTLNVYFNYNNIPDSRRIYNSIYPSILGFDYNDLLAPAPFISITTAMLEPPPYLLLQVLDVKGSCYTQHNYQGQNFTNILCKAIFFPVYQLQRMYPMSQTFNGSEILTKLHLRWLNPDHTLYHFHGRNWSATLNFAIVGEVPILTCG
jgi:hypothetical protein